MLLRWVLTRDKASVLAMADDYGAVWIEVEGKHVERVRPQGWDDVARAYRIDESIPAEERMRAAVLKSTEVVIPAKKRSATFCAAVISSARRGGMDRAISKTSAGNNGAGFASAPSKEETSPSRSIPRLTGCVRDRSPTICRVRCLPTIPPQCGWTSGVFCRASHEAVAPNESSVVDSGNPSSELGVRTEEAPAPPPAACVEQTHRAAYVRRVEKFQKDHSGRNPPVQKTKDGLEGDSSGQLAKGISRAEITGVATGIARKQSWAPPKLGRKFVKKIIRPAELTK